jgi:putative ATPase
MEAYLRIGWPESKYMIAQAILFAVESPKSDAIPAAIDRIAQAFEEVKSAEVPMHLRDAHYSGARKLGHTGYKNPHDYPGHHVQQDYLPDKLRNRTFYEATSQGMEDRIRQNQHKRRQQPGD